MANTTDGIEALQAQLGPKRVKTPLIEVEQFDLKQMDQLAEKSNSFKPSFNNFLFAKVVPKYGCSCEIEAVERKDCCD